MLNIKSEMATMPSYIKFGALKKSPIDQMRPLFSKMQRMYPMILRFRPFLAVALLASACALLTPAAALEKSTMEATGFFKSDNGMYRVNLKTGASEQIVSGWKVESAGISPDGKKIVMSGAGVKAVVNIDGSGFQKLPAELPLPAKGHRIYWSRLGVFSLTNGTLWGHDVLTGDVTVEYATNHPGESAGRMKASLDGTSVYANCDLWGRTFGPKGYRFRGHGFFSISPDGKNVSCLVQSAWGHGEGFTLDGSYVQMGVFGSHNGVKRYRMSDGQLVKEIYWEKGSSYCIHANAVNDNDWLGLTFDDLSKDKFGDGKVHTTLWNWRTNTQLEVPMPSAANAYITGIWMGSDIVTVDDNAAYILPYRKHLTFNVLGRTTPWEKSVRITNIGQGTLGQVAASIEPSGASSWLEATVAGSGNDRTVTVRVKPSGLAGDNQTAKVLLSESSSRNTGTINVTVTKTLLPEPTNIVIRPVTPTDSFEYAHLSWEDNAESEDGYVIEYHSGWQTEGEWRKEALWKEVKRIGANETSIILPPPGHEYYRVRAFDNQGNFSTGDVEWAHYQHKDLQLNMTGPAENTKFNAGDNMTITWNAEFVTDVAIEYTLDRGTTWKTLADHIKEKDNPDYGTQAWTIPGEADGKAVYIRILEWPPEYMNPPMESIGGPFLVGDVSQSEIGPVDTRDIAAAREKSAFALEHSGNRFIAHINRPEPYVLSIYDASGARLAQTCGTGPQVSCSPMAGAGVYLIRCTIGRETVVRKIVARD
jgi:hypothetical protein